jgi:hypothetical protein
MGKSAPKAPDYEAAAQEQAAGSRAVTEQQTWANRPDQYTPFGSMTWQNQQQWDPATEQMLNKWIQTTNLTPDAQRALTAQLGMQAGKSELGASMMGRMQDEFGNPMDWTQFSEGGERVEGGQHYYDQAGDALYSRFQNRMDPRVAQQREGLDAQLRNQGLMPGDEAYDRAHLEQAQQQGDEYERAAQQSTILSGQEGSRMQGMDISAGGYNTQLRQQEIAEAMQQRGFTLNEINAILTGQQVGMPEMPGFNTAQRAEGPQNLAAAQMTGQSQLDAFNAEQAAMQGMMQGAGSMAMGFGLSDRRLKKDIKFIGFLKGLRHYVWTWVWGGSGVGVMADEIPQEFVAVHPSGFLMVDYGRLYG